MKKNYRPKPCVACHEEFAPNNSAQKHCFKCGLRQCSKCKRVKDTSEFGYNKNTPDKCNSYCKDCKRKYMRQRRQDPEYRERELEYMRQRYQDPEYLEQERERWREYERRVRGCVPLENRTCERCGDTYDAIGASQVYCETCIPIVKRIRRHMRRDELTNIPPGLIEWSLKYWDYKCPNCKSDLDNYHLDHHFPLTPQEGKLGGQLVPGNIGLLCNSCNPSKGNTDPSEFYPDNILADIQKFLVRQEFLFGFTLDFGDQPRDTSHELL